MTQILDGKFHQHQVLAKLKESILTLNADHHLTPSLAILLVGDHDPSKIYVKNKRRIAERIGVKTQLFHLPKDVSQNEVLTLIHQLNQQTEVNGILLQLPVPDHLDQNILLRAIAPEKDVDGLHPENMVRLNNQEPGLYPCTPQGSLHLIHAWQSDLTGKLAVVIGRSNLVGRPMAVMLLNENATVIKAHSHTPNLPELCRQADILVCATGQTRMVKKDWVKPGACVIDVGISRDEEARLSGDVDFVDVSPVAGAITPVPGGVGPMTIAYLMVNTVKAAYLQNGLTFG